MFKDILLVGIGSFVGGSLRMVVSKFVQLAVPGLFPWGTLAVNVVGCFLIGVFSSLSGDGFTTFSTFMNENVALIEDGNAFLPSALYVLASLALGFVAVLAGRQLVLVFR